MMEIIEMLVSVLLYLLLEAALLQQLVRLIQNKQSDAGGGQHAQIDKLLDTTCARKRGASLQNDCMREQVMPLCRPLTR